MPPIWLEIHGPVNPGSPHEYETPPPPPPPPLVSLFGTRPVGSVKVTGELLE